MKECYHLCWQVLVKHKNFPCKLQQRYQLSFFIVSQSSSMLGYTEQHCSRALTFISMLTILSFHLIYFTKESKYKMYWWVVESSDLFSSVLGQDHATYVISIASLHGMQCNRFGAIKYQKIITGFVVPKTGQFGVMKQQDAAVTGFVPSRYFMAVRFNHAV